MIYKIVSKIIVKQTGFVHILRRTTVVFIIIYKMLLPQVSRGHVRLLRRVEGHLAVHMFVQVYTVNFFRNPFLWSVHELEYMNKCPQLST